MVLKRQAALSVIASVGLSLLLSWAATQLLRLTLTGPTEKPAETPETPATTEATPSRPRPAVHNQNPTVVLIFMPILVGNSGNTLGPQFSGWLPFGGKGRRRRR